MDEVNSEFYEYGALGIDWFVKQGSNETSRYV